MPKPSAKGAVKKRPLPSKKKEERETEAQELAGEVEVAIPETEEEAEDLMSGVLARMEELEAKNADLLAKLNEKDIALKAMAAQSPEDGGRRLVRGAKDDFELPPQDEPAEPGEYAVFRSPYPGYRQIIKKSKKIRYEDGESEIVPPQIAVFEKGVCVLYDEEEIAMMREKMALKKRRGEVTFVEVTDSEVKEAAMRGTTSIASATVTADTPAESLI